MIILQTLGLLALIAGVIGTKVSPWWIIDFPVAVILLYSSRYIGD